MNRRVSIRSSHHIPKNPKSCSMEVVECLVVQTWDTDGKVGSDNVLGLKRHGSVIKPLSLSSNIKPLTSFLSLVLSLVYHPSCCQTSQDVILFVCILPHCLPLSPVYVQTRLSQTWRLIGLSPRNPTRSSIREITKPANQLSLTLSTTSMKIKKFSNLLTRYQWNHGRDWDALAH